ncbi:helix-turn-helix domain-containing protein [Vreelandella janggokensis]|uniref:helix-turn-helix domain-containing protein n=1 Tax=Vreelandella janggokensis TaxID=370767 RepID=UPI0028574CB1|nr:helix-turn-helix domain-containing protein [Halomonas janggokensis]MDR5887524.1 helix-turn-helix domain-containing protein [Halomonas janggokensis]
MPKLDHLVNDPYSGEELSLSKLAAIYGIAAGTVYSRYMSGKRGMDLITKPKRGSLTIGEQERQRREDLSRCIDLAKGTALARPLKHIADASKMLGGSQ